MQTYVYQCEWSVNDHYERISIYMRSFLHRSDCPYVIFYGPKLYGMAGRNYTYFSLDILDG